MWKDFRLKSYESGIVVMLFFTFGFMFMDRLSINFLMPFIKDDLNLSATDIGLLASALSICWALSGYFFSSIADFVDSRKKVLVPITFGFGLLSFMSGLAKNFYVLFIARALMGVSEGPALPLAQSTGTIEAAPQRKGLVSGVIQSSSQLIGGVAGPLVVTALAVSFGWHWAFFVVGIPGIIMGILLWKFMKDRKVSETPDEAGGKTQKKLSWADYANVFQRRNVWLCVIISACFMTWLFAYSTFAPTFFVESGYSSGSMSLIMAGIGIGSFIWMILVPTISDKIGRKPAMIIFSLSAAISPIVFALFHAPVWILFLVAVLLTTGNGVFPMFMVVIPGESIPVGVVTTAIALVQLVGELVGGTIMPTVSGAAADVWGIGAPLWISAGGAIIGGLVAIGLKETAPAKVGKKSSVSTEGTSLGGN